MQKSLLTIKAEEPPDYQSKRALMILLTTIWAIWLADYNQDTF